MLLSAVAAKHHTHTLEDELDTYMDVGEDHLLGGACHHLQHQHGDKDHREDHHHITMPKAAHNHGDQDHQLALHSGHLQSATDVGNLVILLAIVVAHRLTPHLEDHSTSMQLKSSTTTTTTL
jgi:hypothetical protein